MWTESGKLTNNFGRSRQGLELRVELAYSGIAEVYTVYVLCRVAVSLN